jgi:aldose 1-epimerase
VIELRSGALRLTLAPEIGGAVVAFERDGAPIFRPTPSDAIAAGDVRRSACYPLVPFSNRIAQAKLHWGGATYPLARFLPEEPHAIHGNGWRHSWRVVAADASRVRLEFVHDARGSERLEWPFPYRAQQDFVLSEGAIAMTLALTSTGDAVCPCGLGWHPFFPRSAATELAFAADAMWETDATRLPLRLEPVAEALDFSSPRAFGDTVLDNCFSGWRPPATIRWPEHALSVTIDADAPCRHIVVYVPPGRDFFAVEPVSHMTDAFNRAALAGASDTGTRALAPGETFSCTMRVSVQ